MHEAVVQWRFGFSRTEYRGKCRVRDSDLVLGPDDGLVGMSAAGGMVDLFLVAIQVNGMRNDGSNQVDVNKRSSQKDRPLRKL